MKASLENIIPGFGSSFTLRKFTDIVYCRKPSWHFHPEYEIVYISNGRGKRHIGGHISFYEDGDLIFLGPNLPHFGFTEELNEEHVEYVIQLKEDFLGKDFLQKPEMKAIKQLLERSKNGISFSSSTKKLVGKELSSMYKADPFGRLIHLLSILQIMALTEDYQTLNANGLSFEVNGQDQERMEIIYQLVESNFQQQIPLEQVAKEINMTVPAFCRYFKKLTSKTFTRFVNEFRIAHASQMLADEHLSIANVSYESGFNNLSHFNKQFKIITGLSPREYRKNLTTLIN
ncbi:MAG: AraC family transcriptional regulator [Saprospiraceae bacterium]|jgi:AraC-like DNA-binding protein|nr:AraC family transcriptional regulator [Saprospiraceae bacterium]